MGLYLAPIWAPGQHHGQVIDITVKSAIGKWRAFAPTWALVMGFKSGKITWEEYERQYMNHLRGLWKANPGVFVELVKMASQGDITLVCYCRDESHCHRSLLKRALVAVAGKMGIQL